MRHVVPFKHRISFLSPNQSINRSEIFQPFTEVTTVQVYGRATTGLPQAPTPPIQRPMEEERGNAAGLRARLHYYDVINLGP